VAARNEQLLARTGGTRRPALWGLMTALTLLVAGCAKTVADKAVDGTLEHPMTRTAESDAVSLRFTAAPSDLPYTEKAIVLIEVEADSGTSITMENYAAVIRRGEHPFELSAREVQRKEAIAQPDGRLSWTYRYELEFVLPGEYELPGATLTYVTATSGSDDAEQTEASPTAGESESLSTESITVIAEATDGKELTPEQLAQIEVLPPVEMKEKRSVWLWLAPLLAVLAIAVAIILRRRRRSNRPQAIIVIPAHEWADNAITKLVAEDLPGRGMIQEFHYRISAILRGYIERRYGLLAREMTTEEFLAAAASDPRFDLAASGELDRFQRACDMVKYAKHHATAADGESLLQTTRVFVAQTRERDLHLAGDEDGAVSGGRAA